MLSALDRYRDLAPLLLRVFVGFVLIYGTADNVFSGAQMLEFRPWPGAGAPLRSPLMGSATRKVACLSRHCPRMRVRIR